MYSKFIVQFSYKDAFSMENPEYILWIVESVQICMSHIKSK